MTAIQATVSKFMSLADGTLRIQVDIHQNDTKDALELLCEVGRQVAVAALTDAAGEAIVTELTESPASPPQPSCMAEERWMAEQAGAGSGRQVASEDECDNYAGKLLQQFYRNGFFHAKPVLEALGPDSNFLQWCRGQLVCWACNATGEKDNPIQAAHYRKVAAGAGTGIKPPYCALPLCRKCHLKQHDKGYSAIATVEIWEGWAAKARQEWGHQRLREIFHTTSMTAVPQSFVLEWMEEQELGHLIPKDFR